MPITITQVNISPDLSVADCFFIPFNTNYSVDDLLLALENSKYSIRKFVTKEINLKYSPEVRFHHDLKFDEIAATLALLNQSDSGGNDAK